MGSLLHHLEGQKNSSSGINDYVFPLSVKEFVPIIPRGQVWNNSVMCTCQINKTCAMGRGEGSRVSVTPSHPKWELTALFSLQIDMRAQTPAFPSVQLLVLQEIPTGPTSWLAPPSLIYVTIFSWELWQNLGIADGWDVTSEQILTWELLKPGAHLWSNIFISTRHYCSFKAFSYKGQVDM